MLILHVFSVWRFGSAFQPRDYIRHGRPKVSPRKNLRGMGGQAARGDTSAFQCFDQNLDFKAELKRDFGISK